MVDDTRANYPHYHKPVGHLQYIDVYRVCQLFDVTNPAIAHAIKKLLVPGRRGSKDREKDLREAVVSINRAIQMGTEDSTPVAAFIPTPVVPLRNYFVVFGLEAGPALGNRLAYAATKADAMIQVAKEAMSGVSKMRLQAAEMEDGFQLPTSIDWMDSAQYPIQNWPPPPFQCSQPI